MSTSFMTIIAFSLSISVCFQLKAVKKELQELKLRNASEEEKEAFKEIVNKKKRQEMIVLAVVLAIFVVYLLVSYSEVSIKQLSKGGENPPALSGKNKIRKISMTQHVVSKVADNKKGNINIYPTIINGKHPFIRIVGDPEGLKYLANLLNILADYDQNSNTDPIGTREHTVLSPEAHLGFHSCKVEICRADAKGTGELPEFMEE